MKPWQMLLVLLLSSAPAQARVLIAVGDALAMPGAGAEIVVTLSFDGRESVAGAEVDLDLGPTLAIAGLADGRPDCTVNPQIRKAASGFGFRPVGCRHDGDRCRKVHALIVATDNVETIASGAELFRCRILAPGDAEPGTYPIRADEALYSTPEGRDRAAGTKSGAFVVAGAAVDTPTPPAIATATSRGDGGGGGCQLMPETQNLGFLPMLAAVALMGLRRGRCRRRSLVSRRWSASGAGPRSVAVLTVLLTVRTNAHAEVRIEIGAGSGRPGDLLEVAVRLIASNGELVTATQNDLELDPAVLSIRSTSGGAPDCRVNPAIHKGATSFGFRPTGCDPVVGQCRSLRALVLAFDNLEVIPAGSVLYRCVVGIAGDAPAATVVLRGSGGIYSPPDGRDLRVDVAAGSIAIVPRESGSPTPSPIGSATMTPTATPPIRDPGDANCDGRLDLQDLDSAAAILFATRPECALDCNHDGVSSSADLPCIEARLAGLQ